MKSKVGRYMVTLIVGFALAGLTFISRSAKAEGTPGGAAYYRDEDQPHMEAALQHLRQAQEELNRATSDKGGHRARAIQFARQAQSEIEAGMRFDDTHGGDRR